MIENKYSKWYFSIISAAKNRKNMDNEYLEKHHIIPESFFVNRARVGHAGWIEGNPNEESNLVSLTLREHFLCHWLLTKITTGKAYHKMVRAFYWMMNTNHVLKNRSSIAYSNARTAFIRMQSEELIGPNNPMYGKTHSIEAKNKMSGPRPHVVPWNKGKHMPAATREKISNAMVGSKNPMYGKTHSKDARHRISDAKKGKPNKKLKNRSKSTAHRENLSKAIKEFNSAHVAIHRHQQTIHIDPTQLNQYLLNGYSLGYAKKGAQKNPSKKKKCWVKKEHQCLRINEEDLDQHLLNGWVRGRIY